MIGSRLAGYRVVDQLGEGGMGVVWRGLDESLGREVALKVLPDDVSIDEESLKRFELEARILASLNHPNIATLFSLETAEDQNVLVMELVEGEDLSQIIRRGPTPAEDVVPIACQIAQALEAAHEKGIVHRDLKPANVKIRNDGTVKVLDFGLAKSRTDRTLESGSLSQSPTRAVAATSAGVILGTAGYMAPEQAAGKPVDRRADIWSFGVVLWELLTGHPLFTGDSVPELLASVLRDDTRLEALPTSVDPRFVDLLERCLRRDPRRRLQWIGDARIELEEIAAGPRPKDESTSIGEPPAVSRFRHRTGAGLLAAGVLAGAALGWWANRRPADPIHLVEAFEVVDTEGSGLLSLTNPALSPDSTLVAFVGEGDDRQPTVYLRALDRLAPEKLEGVESAGFVFFSPDGRHLAFFDLQDRVLKKVPASGGLPSLLADPGYVPAFWDDDGSIYFTPGHVIRARDASQKAIWRLSAGDGTLEKMTSPEEGEYHSFCQTLDQGGSLLFASGSGYETEGWNIESLDLESGERRLVLEGAHQATLVGGTHLVFWRDEQLWAAPWSSASRSVVGPSEPVVDDVAIHPNAPAAIGQYDIGATGDLVFVEARGDSDNTAGYLVERSLDGEERRVLDRSPGWVHRWAELSPDGHWLAVEKRKLPGGSSAEVWLMDLEAGGSRQVSVGGAKDAFPAWSRDGSSLYLASSSTAEGKLQLFRKPLVGDAERLESRGEAPVVELEDGSLIWLAFDDERTVRFGRWSSEEGDRWLSPPEQAVEQNRSAISPDRQRLVYTASVKGERDLFVLDLSSEGSLPTRLGRPEVIASTFSPDGRAFYARRPPFPGESSIVRATVSSGTLFNLGSFEPVIETSGVPTRLGALLNWIIITPDGKGVMYPEVESRVQGGRILMIRNWASTLASP